MNNSVISSLLIRLRVRKFRITNSLFHRANTQDAGPPDLQRGFLFDFTDPRYIHFGDLLFFIPLMLSLSDHFPVACIATGNHHRRLLEFLLAGTGIDILGPGQTRPGAHIVTNPYLLLNDYTGQGHIYGLGTPDGPISLPYPIFLAMALATHLGLEFMSVALLQEKIASWSARIRLALQAGQEQQAPMPEQDAVFFSPYLGSGRFRDLINLKRRQLIASARSIAAKNRAKIIVVGGTYDPDLGLTDDNIIDMRGRDLMQMVYLAGSEKIIAGVGFDGFWMHFFDLIHKPYTVKFRGRLTPVAYQLHIDSVNVSFLSQGRRNYL